MKDKISTASRSADAPVKIGRPSLYSEKLGLAICRQIVEGRSLRRICQAKNMPGMTTVMRWLAAHEPFREQYARARELQAEKLFEECLEIADASEGDVKAMADGRRVVDLENINRSRLRVDTRKWMVSKLAPKKYGDRVEHEVSGGSQHMVAVVNLLGAPEGPKSAPIVDATCARHEEKDAAISMLRYD